MCVAVLYILVNFGIYEAEDPLTLPTMVVDVTFVLQVSCLFIVVDKCCFTWNNRPQ